MLLGAIVCALAGFLLLVLVITHPGNLLLAGLVVVSITGLVLFVLDCVRKNTTARDNPPQSGNKDTPPPAGKPEAF